jgi:putative component of membrane protein insertase Oxa1/YidC/SpoIIIJ protein YidD
MRKLFILAIIYFYQKPRKYFNKDSSYCKYYPTCSEYAKLAYEKYGVIKGTKMTYRRVKSCDSNSQGGTQFP